MRIKALDKSWPYTKRDIPEGAELKIVTPNPKFLDLVWVDNVKQVNVYLSTLLNGQHAALEHV